MKILNFSTAIIVLLSNLSLSCNKVEIPPISQGDIWDCHHQMPWDSTSTKEALIGEWKWEYIGCFRNPEDANDSKFKGMTIEFKLNNTLEVKENGKITKTSNWSVINGDGDLFALSVTPTVTQLYGRILFCDERVEFNDSIIDGCDNYFKRMK